MLTPPRMGAIFLSVIPIPFLHRNPIGGFGVLGGFGLLIVCLFRRYFGLRSGTYWATVAYVFLVAKCPSESPHALRCRSSNNCRSNIVKYFRKDSCDKG